MQAETKKGDAALNRVPPWVLLLTIFITGNVVMMLEVVGTRVVGPFFGVGIYVWSALITVTLLALSAGYWLGGKWADSKHRPEFLYLAIALSALFTFLIPVLRNPVLVFSGHFGVRGGVLVGSMILFGPALFLLGIVSPYATKLFTEQFEKLGSRVGMLYAVSTLGSFIGTTLMGFYLIPNFRISSILLGLGLALLIMPLYFYFAVRSRRAAIFVVLALLGTGVLLFFPRMPRPVNPVGQLKVIYKTNSFYGEIKVAQIGNQRVLLVDGVTQSGEDYRSHNAVPRYVDDMTGAITCYHPHAQKALVVGLGGGNIVHSLLRKNMDVDVVEIDKKIKYVAQTYFGVDPAKVNIFLNDGRRYVKTTDKKYDVVVLNTFNGETFPNHLLTREFFEEVQSILNPGGVTVLNFVGYVQGPHREAGAAVLATLRASHDWCHVFFSEPKHKFGNIVYIAGNGEEAKNGEDPEVWQSLHANAVTIEGWEKAVVCTDDYNPVEFLNRVVYSRWRQLVIDSMGPEVLLN